MQPARRWWLGVVVALVGLPHRGAAQVDYRNTERDRPLLVEDAYPMERYGFEGALPMGTRWQGTRLDRAFIRPELSYGLAPNLVVGASAGIEIPGSTPAGRSTRAGFGGFLFYNLARETVDFPALAVRLDTEQPESGGRTVGVAALATRSFGANRVHLNAAWSSARVAAPRWWAGAGIDRTLIRPSLLLQAEATVDRELSASTAVLGVGAGVRLQVTPTLVLDTGLRHRFRGDGETELRLGFARVFGIAGLLPGAGR